MLPCAETAAMLFWAMLASGQIVMRKVNGWETLAEKRRAGRSMSPFYRAARARPSVENEPDDRLLGGRALVPDIQSPFTRRHARLTTSLPIFPLKTEANARRTRRVLVPER